MLVLAGLVVTLALTISSTVGNNPPAQPVVTEPEVDGQVVNPADVHMETGFFSDPNPGDAHLCTDWEIRTLSGSVLVWQASCLTGPESVHTHLGDGIFMGPLAGAADLAYETNYELRVRHRDDSGDPATEWSDWASRTFVTGPPTEIFPLEGDDILESPAPGWADTSGALLVLPPSATPPRLSVESALGDLLLEVRGLNGTVNEWIDFPILDEHVEIRIRLEPGDLATGLLLPESDLSFFDHEGEFHVVYLPAVNVAPGTESVFWIAESGATYVGDAGQAQPDFSELARGVPVPWVVEQPGYRVEIVASGFQLPVNIAFVPNPGPNPGDPLYYVTELYGTIKVVTNDGSVSDYATGLLDYAPTGAFPGSGEQGLTGIVVDPDTGDVIASLLYDAGGPHYPKVVRYSSVDGGLTASGELVLLDMVGEPQGQSHQISNLSIGPDGNLYIHNGDGFDSSTAQNLDSFRGKILRMTTAGAVLVDNPFYDASDGIDSRDYVYAYGLRNPFGGAWRESDGLHYEVENGPSIDRFARVNAGQNYLWDGSNGSMFNFALYNWSPATGPTNIAFIQSSNFGGSLFPSTKLDHAFVAESGPTWATGPQSNGKRIQEYVLDGSGNLVQGPIPFVEYVGTGKATVVALAAGPDGLYFSDFYKDQDYAGPTDLGARILRVRFLGDADFTADVTEGDAPLTVQFTDTSSVPLPSAWEWDFGDGTNSTEQSPSHVYTQDGIYDVSLSVVGASGVALSVKNGFIRVGDFPRVAFITGNGSPSGADAEVVEHLLALGLDVIPFDDEPANRPPASEIALDHDLVVISSTVLSSNIAGEFRTEAVPLIFWEQALARVDREPLADDGVVVFDSSQIDIVDGSHPITSFLGAGDVTVYESSDAMSVVRNPIAAGATILARRSADPGDVALVVAEEGALLLGGLVAPARRAFFFLEDSSFLNVTEEGEQLFLRTVLWALGVADGFRRGDCNGDGALNISDPIRVIDTIFGTGAAFECEDACDGNDDGILDVADAIAMLNALFQASPLPEPLDCGADGTSDGLGCETPCF